MKSFKKRLQDRINQARINAAIEREQSEYAGRAADARDRFDRQREQSESEAQVKYLCDMRERDFYYFS
jgi:hypothetical protein